mmetsp:Transcript_43981/g.115538  ORF Transcript_43981/g.115538 Transcript_43981/m.115538 type:complete len:247 (-) Transcript_43981:531-1271(-)
MVGFAAACNYAAVALTFSLLIGSTFSQRARVGLVWITFPALMVFAVSRVLSGPFDLVKELTFYASYHSEPHNQIIHVIFVPLLIATVMVFSAYVAPPLPKVSWLTWPLIGAAAWSTHHINASPLVGTLVSMLTFAFAFSATALVAREKRKAGPKAVPSSAVYGQAAFYAGLLHMLGWYMQIHPGHGIYEGRKPALLEGMVQAFMDAPLFVWYEALFYFGFDPALKDSLNSAVADQHRAWAQEAAAA